MKKEYILKDNAIKITLKNILCIIFSSVHWLGRYIMADMASNATSYNISTTIYNCVAVVLNCLNAVHLQITQVWKKFNTSLINTRIYTYILNAIKFININCNEYLICIKLIIITKNLLLEAISANLWMYWFLIYT